MYANDSMACMGYLISPSIPIFLFHTP